MNSAFKHKPHIFILPTIFHVEWKCGNGTHDRQVSWKSEGKSWDFILLVYLAKIPHLHNSKHPHRVSIVENIPIILFPSQTHPCTLRIKNLQKLYIAKHKSKVVFPLKLTYFTEPCYMNEDNYKKYYKVLLACKSNSYTTSYFCYKSLRFKSSISIWILP